MQKNINTKLIIIFIFAAAFLATPPTAEATPVTGFEAGKIIDDAVMTNKTSMSVIQIQTFLNSKVPTCDTYGSQLSEYGGGTRAQWAANVSRPFYPPFTCLKDYTENGLTSSQIIYDAAQQYQINPQVLIVLLQKEQVLITDTWPSPGQYRSATGYGCPDTAACDSDYYGLTNQVRNAAKMFRRIMDATPTWYTPYVLGNNYIQYSPDVNCGGTTVNIQNRATQALYNYTPYQPNQASLDAGYGSGTYCSAYGNRNFYLYFTDWFGSPLYNIHRLDGKPVKGTDAGAGVYKVENGTKRSFPSLEVFLAYYNWPEVVTISNAELTNIPDGDVMQFNIHRLDGRAVKGTGIGAGIYKIDNGTKRSFSSAQEFLNFFNWSDVITISDEELAFIPEGININYDVHTRDGKPIRTSAPNSGVWLIENGVKRPFPTEEVFLTYFNWSDVVIISDIELSLIPEDVGMNYDVHTRDGKPIRTSAPGSGIWLVEDGAKRPFPTAEVFLTYFNWSDVVTISNLELGLIPIGLGLNNNIRIYDGKAVKGPSAGAGVFKIENSTKRPFPTAEVFYAYYKWSDVVTISDAELNNIPLGADMQ